ncbi:L-ectoine synthase [Stutzerimonas xanthomarina]|nr:L-ectoine synthase [Stutzerimonas xanthomarina]
MIIRQLQDCEQTPRHVVSPDGNWESTRLLLKDDHMGFSFHITTIRAGADFRMHYQHHLESVYCISGAGEVLDLASGRNHAITPGTLYILDQHDRHVLRAFSELKMACVFNPPLHGKEVHNAEGTYELSVASVDV